MNTTILFPITKSRNGENLEVEDTLAIEEPLEIILIQNINNEIVRKTISITMRTPGNDAELANGFLFTEGIITDFFQIEKTVLTKLNTVEVFLNKSNEISLEKLNRHFYTTSSCGVCGKTSMDAIRTIQPGNDITNPIVVEQNILFTLPATLRQHQEIFESTGGLHASALFTRNGRLTSLREDVGRHNALDKLIGNQLMLNRIPLKDYILLLSGRASFELIQKAIMAGIQCVASIGAPSSLAVELAIEFNITLIGFLKKDGLNIYTNPTAVI